MENVFPALNAR